ncbi:MAG: gamma carbonic anhydrase family protein [Pseudomonadota bacterium]
MAYYSLGDLKPKEVGGSPAFIAADANIIGHVEIGADVNIWFGTAVRGDNEPIIIGPRTNLQEHSILHTDMGYPLTIGEGCTIGHRALLHGCTIGDNSLIGMGAIVLNGAVIGENCLVGAGALVTERKTFPDNSLIVGAPAKAIRTLDDKAIEALRISAKHYVDNGKRFARDMKPVG